MLDSHPYPCTMGRSSRLGTHQSVFPKGFFLRRDTADSSPAPGVSQSWHKCVVTITSQLLSDSRPVFLHGQDEPLTFIVCALFRPCYGCHEAALFNCSDRDADASSAAVLGSSYYWGRSPLFIPLKGSAGAWGWLLGKRTTPSRRDRNKTPTLSGNSSFAQTRPCACPKRNHFQRKSLSQVL